MRVLLLRLSAMGDVVQSLGAVQALAAARPELQLHFVTQRPFVPLLQGLPGLAGVVAHDRTAGLRGLWRTGRTLRTLHPDVVLDLQGNGKSALLAWLSCCPRRLGAAAAWRQEPWSARLLTHRVEVPGPRHPALVAHTLVRELAPAAATTLPRLVATADECAREAAALRGLGVDAERPFRVVLLGAAADNRAQRAVAMARELASSPLPVLLLAGPHEIGVEPPAPASVLRHGADELRRLVALGALLAQSGGDVVGGDNGALHVLAASGARTTALFGAQDPAQTAPPAARVLQHRAPPPCMPCRSRACRHRDGPVCMEFSSADGVPAP